MKRILLALAGGMMIGAIAASHAKLPPPPAKISSKSKSPCAPPWPKPPGGGCTSSPGR